MSIRKTNFGARMTSRGMDAGRAQTHTRRQVEQQGHDRAFDTAPATRQWTCSNGHVNPASKSRCRYCGEAGGVQ